MTDSKHGETRLIVTNKKTVKLQLAIALMDRITERNVHVQLFYNLHYTYSFLLPSISLSGGIAIFVILLWSWVIQRPSPSSLRKNIIREVELVSFA